MCGFRSMLVLGLLLACPAMGSADLRFSQPKVDLGELRGGPAYQHRFEFSNDSTEAIEIIDIRLGCGCLQPVLEKRILQPGEKSSLLMHLRTLGQMDGPRTWQARVQYRQGNAVKESTLTLAATLRNEITVEPSILAMSVETTLRQEVLITDRRALPVKVASVLASSPAVRVSVQPQINGCTKVILEVSGAALAAARQEEMLNIYMDDPNYRHLQVPITLMKASRSVVSVTPERVEFRGTSAGSVLVRLRAPGEQRVIVAKAESNYSGVKFIWAAGPGNDATLRIWLDANRDPAKDVPTHVQVLLAQPAMTTITIPVQFQKD